MIVVSEATFDSEVTKSDIPVLVYFAATWCAPCKVLGPILEGIVSDKVKIVKVDVDNDSELGIQFGIRSVPSLFCVRNGIPTEWGGVRTREQIYSAIATIE